MPILVSMVPAPIGPVLAMAYSPINRGVVRFAPGTATTDAFTFINGSFPADVCDGADSDDDDLVGCDDPDCWGRCTPTCPPFTSCVDGPGCGDGACDVVLEDAALCPVDCG